MVPATGWRMARPSLNTGRRGLGLELGLVVHVLEQVDPGALVVDLRVVQDDREGDPRADHEQARHRDERERNTFGQEEAEVEHGLK